MIEEYKVPETKVVYKTRFTIDISLILAWVAGVLVVGGIIFGIACAVLSTDNLTIGDKVDDHCYYITDVEKHVWSPDIDRSGVYCMEEK